ncbi:hypothetical protein [Streptomyces sp. NPDC058335]|uniref:hypothetical protein n=1 Tax=Streptomyces sp. NPDC058335 TaxID=3346451 RepID=UPI003653CF44
MGLTLACAGLAPDRWILAAAVAGAGIFVGPIPTTAYLSADETAAPGASAGAGTWINTGVNAGSSLGSATSGLLLGHAPLAVCFAAAGAPALVTAAVAGTGAERVK